MSILKAATVENITLPLNLTMARTNSNKTSTSTLNLGLLLSSVYLNLTIDTANGSEYYQIGQAFLPGNIPLPAPRVWPEYLGAYRSNYAYNRNDINGGNDVDGYQDRRGFYDDLLSSKNTYNHGKTYENGYDYGRGNVIGGGYNGLDGRNKGHQTSGFSTSYRKDESGDKRTYYDDGIGHHGMIQYGAHDTRFRDLGGSTNKGGYYDGNLNRNALGNSGKYGDSYRYRGYATHGSGHSGNDGYGGYGGFRRARLFETPPGLPIKNSAIYVIPTPKKLFFDATVPPQV